MNPIKQFWIEHGTKLIGFCQASFGALVAADAAAKAAGGSSILSPKVLGLIITAVGLLTAWRGFFNTRQNEVQK